MRRRGMTLAETLVAAGILALMLGLAAFAMVAYLRSYRQYTELGLKLRSCAKASEAICHHLRSAERLYEPESAVWEKGFSLEQHPLVYQERGAGPARISWQKGQVMYSSGQQSYTLGRCAQVLLHSRARMLTVQCDELSTGLSLRGIH